jgi:site-specific DNA-methyltransferase (adenine-specific)
VARSNQRRRTATSNFGAGARESHDATRFYERFRAPEVSSDDIIAPPVAVDQPFVVGDSRHLHTVADNSVALVMTSPPYFAGKQYEEELERDGIPSSYLEYLQMLTDVFAECRRVLEPGGRIAVNVANLGRKPYRSLSADVIRILEHELGLLLRGEIVWQKGEGASGSCAWGSFRSPANPVLRDLSERIIVASKGRFDRAISRSQRQRRGLPHIADISTDDFLASTLDVWSLPPESARRVGHPAPFPVELPEQLIRLYTYRNDLVLDPFLGSGSTLVAAARLGRRYVGYDLDPSYVALAQQRVAATALDDSPPDPRSAGQWAEQALLDAQFVVTGRDRRIAGTGVVVAFVADDPHGREWWFELAGSATSMRGGMIRNEVTWRTLGRVAALRGHDPAARVVVLTPHLPTKGSEAAHTLASATRSDAGPLEVVQLDEQAAQRLSALVEATR